MIKKLMPFVVLMPALAITAYSAPITPLEALSRAQGSGPMKSMAAKGVEPRLVYTSITEKGQAASYLYASDSGAFMILSADDQAYPVLGYGDNLWMDNEEMAPGLKWLLGEYARQIEYARAKGVDGIRKSPYFESDWERVEPLVSTKWNQDAPYNDACPLLNSTRTYTGCVATAMAQVMNYFKYPEVGEGTSSYVWSKQGKKLTLNFSRKEFDWDNMLDSYFSGSYNEAQADAVSYLMKACGYSTQMNYGLDASGTQGVLVSYAARTYFKYDGNTHSAWRDAYPTSEWTKMVYENIRNVGPMVMNGQSVDGGHSFVCDGYDGKGYFHFNWGWGGVSDGYYALDALSPEVQGIGGYDSGFNFDQDAIFGMQPPTGEPVVEYPARMLQYGLAYGTIDGRHLTFGVRGSSSLGWGNASDRTLIANVGVIIEPANGGEKIEVSGSFGYLETVNLPVGSYYPMGRNLPNVELPDLPDGSYRVILATREVDKENAQWEPVVVTWSYPNYVIVEVSNGVYSVVDVIPPSLTIADVEAVTSLYIKKYCEFKVSVKNTNDIELTRTITPMFYNGENAVISGDPAIVTVNASSENLIEWVSKLKPLNGYSLTEPTELKLVLVDTESGHEYGEYGMFTVEPEPAKGTVSMTGCSIPGSQKGEYEYGGKTYPSVFFVSTGEFTYDLSFSVKRGYFDGMINVGIYEENPLNNSYLLPVVESIYTESPFMSGGESRSLEIPVSFTEAVIGKPYYVRSEYTDGSRYSTLGQTVFVVGTSGVESIIGEESGEARYFNLQGLEVENPSKGDVLIEKRGSKVRKIVVE